MCLFGFTVLESNLTFFYQRSVYVSRVLIQILDKHKIQFKKKQLAIDNLFIT